MKRKTLGRVQKTRRNFELIEFSDYNGQGCSLQASSLAGYLNPGTTAIWLGCNEAKNHPSTGEPLSPRMHLKRDQVAALIYHLKKWLDTDSFK